MSFCNPNRQGTVGGGDLTLFRVVRIAIFHSLGFVVRSPVVCINDQELISGVVLAFGRLGRSLLAQSYSEI